MNHLVIKGRRYHNNKKLEGTPWAPFSFSFLFSGCSDVLFLFLSRISSTFEY